MNWSGYAALVGRTSCCGDTLCRLLVGRPMSTENGSSVDPTAREVSSALISAAAVSTVMVNESELYPLALVVAAIVHSPPGYRPSTQKSTFERPAGTVSTSGEPVGG